jgi:hypothetical protein
LFEKVSGMVGLHCRGHGKTGVFENHHKIEVLKILKLLKHTTSQNPTWALDWKERYLVSR